jgi:signal transduction histidine kinase
MGAAAHDLRTPLNTMAGWLQVLQSGQDLPEATRERAFKGLQSAVAQQAALADGLAQIASVSAEGAALEVAPVDVGGALADALAAMDGEARAKAVTLDFASREVWLESDGPMVAALLRHALAASLKFSAKGSRLAVDLAPLADAVAGGCSVSMTIEQSLLPAPGIAAILRYVAGFEPVKPNGVGAAFFFGVGQGIANFLGGSIEVADGDGGPRVVVQIRLPGRR